MEDRNLEIIYLAGGCFWGVEAFFNRIKGVTSAVSGYANGNTAKPSYEDVIYAGTNHAETVQVTFDRKQIDLVDILLHYFKIIDPTSLNRQGNDIGSQYRVGIYYTDEGQVGIIQNLIEFEKRKYIEDFALEVLPMDNFYEAEDYHQDYLAKHPMGYCHVDLSLADQSNDRTEYEDFLRSKAQR